MKQSGGYVWVYSELGHGTDFKIYLPMVETLAESKARSQRSQEPLARGSETILLVEDDPALREVTCDFLRTSGDIVLTAGSPEEALRLAHSHYRPIDFLLTDVIMPGMNGRELAAKLSAISPQLSVLYVSGYPDGIVRNGTRGVLEPGLAFLQKPYTRHTLIRKVREILDSAQVKMVSGKR